MSSQWEIVMRKKNKADKNKKVSKSDKLKFKDNAPKIEDCVPISQNKTMFDVLDEKPGGKSGSSPIPEKVTKTKTKQKQPCKVAHSKKKPPEKQTHKSAMDISLNEVHDLYTLHTTQFQGVPSLFLRNLAALLNNHIAFAYEDVNFTSKSFEYPSCYLPVDVSQFIKMKLKTMLDPTFVAVYHEFLEKLTKDMLKGSQVMGYKITIQLMAMNCPQVAVSNLKASGVLCSSYINRSNICLSLLWALGQGGFKDITVGLTVWSKVMLPICMQKKYTNYVISYITQLLDRHSTSKSFRTMHYFSLYDEVMPYWQQFSNPHQLEEVFSQLKVILCNGLPETELHTLFVPLLERLHLTRDTGLWFKVLDFIIYILSKDIKTYEIWRNIYMDKLSESAELLGYINTNWNDVMLTLCHKELKQTFKSFILTNKKLQVKKQKRPGLDACTGLCEELILKLSNSSIFLWLLVIFSLGICILVGLSSIHYNLSSLEDYLWNLNVTSKINVDELWNKTSFMAHRIKDDINSFNKSIYDFIVSREMINNYFQNIFSRILFLLDQVREFPSSLQHCMEFFQNLTRKS